MAILHGEYFLELIIIFLLGLTSGSPLIKVFNLEDMELKEYVVLNGFSGILDDRQTGSKCDIGNSSCGFHDMKKLVLCEDELKGIGSLNTTCQLNTSLQFDDDVLITGEGNLDILSHVSVGCPSAGCLISINISGDLLLGEYASLLAGTLIVRAGNLFLQNNSFLKTTALGGAPPHKTSGTPLGVDGANGGHGGRGACCVKSDGKDPEDTWGGDAYAWSTLTKPWSHGSRGGTLSREGEFGGGGGGRVKIIARSILNVNGTISADGGDGGLKGGGGSGGSIIIRVPKL